MNLLDQTQYHKVLKPLHEVTINNLFARSVVERKVTGTIYVDNPESPTTFYVVHPYGMSLLFGETENEDFNSAFVDYALNTFKVRDKVEWLQAFPESWTEKMQALFGDHLVKFEANVDVERKNIVEQNTRVNFEFNKERYLEIRSAVNTKGFEILQMDQQLFGEMEGSVVPKHFWDNSEDFCKHGAGYSLIFEKQIACTAFSSYVHDDQFELGIETRQEFRGMGFAIQTCCVLIDYSLDHGFTPVWSCRLENLGSYKLAMKLGFEPTVYIPYYKLNA